MPFRTIWICFSLLFKLELRCAFPGFHYGSVKKVNYLKQICLALPLLNVFLLLKGLIYISIQIQRTFLLKGMQLEQQSYPETKMKSKKQINIMQREHTANRMSCSFPKGGHSATVESELKYTGSALGVHAF